MAKAPLQLNWSEILPGRDESTTPEVEVVRSSAVSAAAVGGDDDVGEAAAAAFLPDHELQGQIQRLAGHLSTGVGMKLPDKGAKLRAKLRRLQEELNRRKLAPRKDAGGFDKGKRSRIEESTDSVKDSTASYMPSESCPQSEFGCQFLKKLNRKADEFHKSRESELQMHEGKWPSRSFPQPPRMSSRESPFRSVSSFANKGKERSFNGHCKAIDSSSISPVEGKKISSLPTIRKRASKSRDLVGFTRKKVQEVVLLDEEDVQPVQPTQEDASNQKKEVKIYYPSRDDPESVELSYEDLKCLEPESYLSSPIMNFYIRYLQRAQSPTGRSLGEYHFFNTYFYKKLEEAVSCKGDKKAYFLKLRRWWRGVNIFQKAYVFLPIHGDLHWSLVIICMPAKEDESGPIILHLDSLGLHNSTLIFEVVERYLEDEWSYINQNAPLPSLPILEKIWKHLPRRIEKKKPKVPQQKNEFDCGLFVLYFMERFVEEAPERLRRKDLPMFASRWFHPEEASNLRKRIRDLLLEVFESDRLENDKTESASSGSSLEDDGQ